MNEKLITMELSNPIDAWEIKRDGFFKEKISEMLKEDDIPDESVIDIFNNAAQILNNCPNPRINEPGAKTGIVIGKVQSGKTSNFISLIALAFDNDYDIAVVLGGNKKNLVDQNAGRIEQSFKVKEEKLVVLRTSQNKALLNAAAIKQFLARGSKVIIVGLKHEKHINDIAEIFNDNSLRNASTLIIDDEGDQATLNTKKFKSDMSTIYAAVLNLKNKLERHCFISITATPQANILIDTVDVLSPDFGELVYPGENYCGLMHFHGEDQDKYIKVIPDKEPNLLDDGGMPLTFYKALATFFIGGALRQYRGDVRSHSMLVHPSQKKYDHNNVIKKVTTVLDKWRELAKAKIEGINDISYISLEKHLKEAYSSNETDGVIMPSFEELEYSVLKNIIDCSPVHLCNSDENASENAKYYKLNIYVGGNMVERGITLKGLAVTYITRRAKGKSNVDNTEQRARWFGYKYDYLDVCRVFTTMDIKKDFSSILEHDEDLWASIERVQARGEHFKDIPRIFRLANTMLELTRKNVARADRFNFSEWTKQNKFLFNKEIAKSNHNIVNKLFEKYSEAVEIIRYRGQNVQKRIQSLSLDEVKSKLLSNFVFPSDCNIDSHFFVYLEEAMIKAGINPEIDIFLVRSELGETRAIYEDGTINQLFQGHSPNRQPDSVNYYPGDSKMVIGREHVMQIQIHFVGPSNMPEIDFKSPTLAVYMPKNYASEMSKLVGRTSERS